MFVTLHSFTFTYSITFIVIWKIGLETAGYIERKVFSVDSKKNSNTTCSRVLQKFMLKY